MCKNEFKDNNHFGSRNSTFEIWALEIPESRMSSKRHSDTLCVKGHTRRILSSKATSFDLQIILTAHDPRQKKINNRIQVQWGTPYFVPLPIPYKLRGDTMHSGFEDENLKF